MTDLSFRRSNGGAFTIASDALVAIHRYRQMSAEPEAGGVLLGRMYFSAQEVIVDHVTEPTVADRRARFNFFRARTPTQHEINRVWTDSNGTRNYLGEWHTHPEDRPRPSTVDLANWRRLTEHAVFEQDSLFFVIVGRRETRAWEMVRGGVAATPLVRIVESAPRPGRAEP